MFLVSGNFLMVRSARQCYNLKSSCESSHTWNTSNRLKEAIGLQAVTHHSLVDVRQAIFVTCSFQLSAEQSSLSFCHSTCVKTNTVTFKVMILPLPLIAPLQKLVQSLLFCKARQVVLICIILNVYICNLSFLSTINKKIKHRLTDAASVFLKGNSIFLVILLSL